MKYFLECSAYTVIGILIGISIALASAKLDCVDSCKCSGRNTEGCTCITATAVKCPCRDCPCENTYTDKAALEDIKALKKKIESHCCEKE